MASGSGSPSKAKGHRQHLLSGSDLDPDYDPDTMATPMSCAQCEDDNPNKPAFMYCDICGVGLCDDCTKEHRKNVASKKHKLVAISMKCGECPEYSSVYSFCVKCNYYLCTTCHHNHAQPGHNMIMGAQTNTTIIYQRGSRCTRSSETFSDSTQSTSSMEFLNQSSDFSTGGNIATISPRQLVSMPIAPMPTHPKPTNEDYKLFLEHSKKTASFNIKIPSDEAQCWIYATLALPSGEFVLADCSKNNNIKLFNESFEITSVLQLENHCPCDTCLCNKVSGNIYATIPDAKEILCISTEMGLTQERTFKTRGRCHGITCFNSGIAVMVRSNRDQRFELQLFKHDGSWIRQICQDESEHRIFKNSFYMTSIMNGEQVVISNWEIDSVIAVDIETSIVSFTYSHGRLKGCHGVTTDNFDNIYVVGWKSNSVQVLSPSGHRIRTILREKDGLYLPKGICFNKYNDTLLLQPNYENNELKVYKVYSELG